jgi:hypothetical protein
MQSPASLVPLKNILLRWTESSDQSRLKRPFPTWADAEDAIHTMAKFAPERGYDKTGFSIEWADGERYDARLDVARSMTAAPAPLSRCVRRALAFIAGRWRPDRMTDGQQREFLAEGEKLSPGRAAWAGKILDGYDLGGVS